MSGSKDFSALARKLQQLRTQTQAALQQGLGDVAQTLEAALQATLTATPELRDSIQHTVQGLSAVVGSASEALLHREQGSAGQVPQPLFAQVASHAGPDIENLMGEALARRLAQDP